MIELIWDAASTGTATTSAGASITIGDAADFSPEDLVAVAAAGCLMRTFLKLADAAGVPVFGYAAVSQVESSGSASSSHVLVRCSVVSSGDISEAQLRRLLQEATDASPVCRMLAGRVVCHADVRCLCGECPG
ncbi:MAG: OsmC family protein [Acidobacteriota bacterium]